MREALFWEAINFSRGAGRRDQAACLYEILIELPEREIVDFGRIQRRKMRQLYKPDILAAHFIVCSYTSDDSFEDFTAWVVAQGKKAFDAIRKSPAHLAQILEKKDVSRMRWDFTLLAGQAYAATSGKDDYTSRVNAPAPPPIPIRWPDDRKAFEVRYPVLYRKFWTPETDPADPLLTGNVSSGRASHIQWIERRTGAWPFLSEPPSRCSFLS